MDTLRIVLILAGIALIAGIFLWERIQSRRRDEPVPWQDVEIEKEEGHVDPLIDNENPFDGEWRIEAIQARRESGSSDEELEELKGIVALTEDDVADENTPHPQPEDAVIIFSLMAGEGRHFTGMQLLEAMEVCGLSFGEMGVFHYYDLDSDRSLFSVANVLEPGSFDREHLDTLETPGLALFMPLPTSMDGEKALLIFVQQAKRLKDLLGGKLTDSQRRELTRETLDELKIMARRYREPAE